MKKQVEEVDFLMIYEHKVRELENLCLIKYELERRGYKVVIKHIEDEEALDAVKPVYHAKVVTTMACYQNASLEWHTKDFVSFDKVIDMQWENIVYPKDERAGVFKNRQRGRACVLGRSQQTAAFEGGAYGRAQYQSSRACGNGLFEKQSQRILSEPGGAF